MTSIAVSYPNRLIGFFGVLEGEIHVHHLVPVEIVDERNAAARLGIRIIITVTGIIHVFIRRA
jgi:hypothetical protein